MSDELQKKTKDLERRINELQARRDELGKEHQALSITIEARTTSLGGKLLAGRDARSEMETQTRDRVKAEGLLSAMQQADAQLRDFRTELLGLRRDQVTDRVEAIQAELRSLAKELDADTRAIYAKADRAVTLQQQVRGVIAEFNNIIEPDVRARWEQFRPFGQCTRIRGTLDPLIRALDAAQKGDGYIT